MLKPSNPEHVEALRRLRENALFARITEFLDTVLQSEYRAMVRAENKDYSSGRCAVLEEITELFKQRPGTEA